MAPVQERNTTFRILFCYLGKRHTLNLGKVSADSAARKADQIDYLLLRLKQELIAVPPGVSVEHFMLHAGHEEPPEEEPEEEVEVEPVPFADLKDRYLETHRNGAMEENSLDTVKMHLRHFERTLGARFSVQGLTLADLQRLVNRRAAMEHRGKKLSPVPLRKETASFRAAWNWASHMGRSCW
jgi:hypothetical protein